MPSSLGAAASWDQDSACDFGTVIGQELRAQGFNMTLGGGVDLAREPRNGRSFEYAGEDPLLAGTVVGNLMKCEQAQHVVGDIKHYVMNDQETGRFFVNSVISKRAMQEAIMIADRTRKALATAKAKGTKLGRRDDKIAAYAIVGAKAEKRTADLIPRINHYRSEGATTLRQIAALLNAEGIQTARGGEWSAVQVARVIQAA
jgi:hypothetical protein